MPVQDKIKLTNTLTYDVPSDLSYGVRGLTARWEVRLWKPSVESLQPAHFSVTGETRLPNQRDCESCGCLHGLLEELASRGLLGGRDAILPELLRWHLFDIKDGPIHYIANAEFWYKIHLRQNGLFPKSLNPWERDYPEDKEALRHFKSTIIFGALEDDAIPKPPELPRSPDASDEFVFEPKIAEWRQIEWRKRCDKFLADMLVPWLESRLPRLMTLFEADMVRWFGPDILVK